MTVAFHCVRSAGRFSEDHPQDPTASIRPPGHAAGVPGLPDPWRFLWRSSPGLTSENAGGTRENGGFCGLNGENGGLKWFENV